jgi:peptidoglycan/LPS O-acetylase OafA/YrhL
LKITKVGYLFGAIGAIIMIVSEVLLGLVIAFLFFLLSVGVTGPGLYNELTLMPITILSSLALGVIALRYVIKSKKGSKRAFLIILIIGVIAAIGVFIPIQPARILDIGGGDTYPAPAINLVNSIIYIEPYLLINSGLVGLLTFTETGIEELDYVEADDYSLLNT